MPLRPAVLLVTALLGLSQCMNEGPAPEDALPAATQTGANTAGCRVDGIPWRAKQTSIFAGEPVRAYWGTNNLGGRTLRVSLEKYDDERKVHSATTMSLFVPDIRVPGSYVLDQRPDVQLYFDNPPHATFIFARTSG